MNKKLMRKAALFMAAILIFACLSPIAAVKATAAETNSTQYYLKDLVDMGGWGNTVSVSGNSSTIDYSSLYAEEKFGIPEEVIAAGFDGFAVDLSDDSIVSNFTVKLYSEDGTELKAAYGSDTLVSSDTDYKKASFIGLMNSTDGAAAFTVEGVQFKTKVSVGETYVWPVPETTYEATYPIKSIEVAGGYGYTADADGNAIAYTYADQYQEVFLKIPQDVLNAGLKGYKVNLKDYSVVGTLGVKFRGADTAQLGVDYGKDTLMIDDSSEAATLIGLMNCGSAGNVVTVKSITFITDAEVSNVPVEISEDPADPAVPESSIVSIPSDAPFCERWSGTPNEGNVLEFNSQYYEYVVFPEEPIDMANVEKIVVKMSNQGAPICLKLHLIDDLSIGDDSENAVPLYGLSGSNEYTISPLEEGKIYSFGIMSHADGYEFPYSLQFDGIDVYMKTPAGPVQRTYTYDGSLEFSNRWNGSDKTGNTISFPGQYTEYVFAPADTVNIEDLKKLTIKVSGQGGAICFKTYVEGNESDAFYNQLGSNEYVFTNFKEAEGAITGIGVMSNEDVDEVNGNYPYGITIESITFETEENPSAQKTEESLEWTVDDVDFFVQTGENLTAPEGGELSFSKQWDEYRTDLGRNLNMAKCKKVIVKASGQPQGKGITFKLYTPDGTEVNPVYDQYSASGTYTFVPSVEEEISGFSIMAHAENNDGVYPYGVTFESVTFVMDTTPDSGEPVDKEVEEDIVDLRDCVAETVGDDFLIGTAISYQEFADAKEMRLVTKHFNAVTLGNELKPDSMLKANAARTTVEIDGEEIEVPVLDFSNPDRYLDFFVNWNNENPDDIIKVRGHVLVWHSQMPSFYFYEDFDTSKNFVSKDLMNKRLEYYIKSVAEHYFGENSPYKDLFYGWDVVNEAISDGTGTYRNAGENSMWWALYQSPEFIQNAFVYANKYFPSDVALFYNDYNEYVNSKVEGICTLLETVKNTPGARIDGMGLQGHYQVAANQPTMDQFKNAAIRYLEIVDQVQITELDFKGSTGPTDENLANRYKDVYDTIRRMRNDGYNITGMTIWGVVDKHSWLQSQNSAGGGSTTSSKQYPLLFDNNYKAKNSFWAIADAGELTPEIKNVVITESSDGDFTIGNEYSFNAKDGGVSFVPVWNENDLMISVSVSDSEITEDDKVVLVVDNGVETVFHAVSAADAQQTSFGYETVYTLTVGKENLLDNKVRIDVIVVDDGEVFCFNDTTGKVYTEENTDYIAATVAKQVMSINKGTIDVENNTADDWAGAKEYSLYINLGSNVSAKARLLWDEENLYVRMAVEDPVLNEASNEDHQQDSVEIFIDENDEKSGSYQADDKQYRISYTGKQTYNGTKCLAENITSKVEINPDGDGYVVVAAIKWTDITPVNGVVIGLELQVNDADESGTRIGTLSWADKSGEGWTSTSVFGSAVLCDASETDESSEDDPATPVNPSEGDNPGTPVNPSEQSQPSTPAAPTQPEAEEATAEVADAPVIAVPGRQATNVTPVEPAAEPEEEEQAEVPSEEITNIPDEEVPEAVSEPEEEEEGTEEPLLITPLEIGEEETPEIASPAENSFPTTMVVIAAGLVVLAGAGVTLAKLGVIGKAKK